MVDKKGGSVSFFDKQWKNYRESRFRNKITTRAQVDFFIKQRINDLVTLFEKAEGKKVINCGCGAGTWSIPLAKLGYEVTNFDLSHEAIKLTKERFLKENFKGNFKEGDLRAIDYEDDTFDIVVSFGVLEHFEDVEPVIKEMIRILKPNGIFLADIITKRFSIHSLETWINKVLSITFYLLTFKFNKIIRVIMGDYDPDFYENIYSYKFYEDIAKKHGLDSNVKGVRAFPFINLPKRIDEKYASFLRIFSKAFKRFDNSSSKFSRFWGAIWALSGIKKGSAK